MIISTTLTVAQAAALLGLSEVSIRKHCQKKEGQTGRLPAHKHGRDWAIELPALEALRLELEQDRRSKLYKEQGHKDDTESLSALPT